MITKEDLLARSYREYMHDQKLCDNVCYQKTVVGQTGERLYFLFAFIWRFPFPEPHSIVEFNARFYLPKGNRLVGSTGITIKLNVEDTATVESVEGFYRQAFEALDFVPDIHAN